MRNSSSSPCTRREADLAGLEVARRAWRSGTRVGVRSTTRTGPSQGPGMRTTYSSPTAMSPSVAEHLLEARELARGDPVEIGADARDELLRRHIRARGCALR